MKYTMGIPRSILSQFELLNSRGTALLSLVDETDLQIETNAKNQCTLLDSRNTPSQYVHEKEDPEQEAQKWTVPIIKNNPDLVVVFGLGLAWHWKVLKTWLQKKKSRKLVILEDDLATISIFLKQPIAKEFFEDPQTTLLYFDEKEQFNVFQILAWNAYKKRCAFIASPAYTRYRSELFDYLFQELIVLQNDVTSVLDEFFTFSEGHLHNFGRNFFMWQKSKQASSLFNQCTGIPAIVVAAGPSLEKDLETLKSIETKALILSGGSSIGALLQGGVMPHATATVDPNPTQYTRLRQAQPFCLPLFYRSRTLYEALMHQQGTPLYLRGGDGYSIIEWFEERLGIIGESIDGGNSVSNMLIDIARALGCDPIIMVGYDLAYTDGKAYANTVTESLSSKESLKFSGETPGELVPAHTPKGKSITSEAKWIIEAKWIEKFQKSYPQTTLINTAVHGLALQGITTMPLQQALKKISATQIDIESLFHLAVQEADPISFSNEDLSLAIGDMSTSLQETKKILKKVMERLKNGEVEDSPYIAELLLDLKKETPSQYALMPFIKMHEKFSFMKKIIACRPYQDEEQIKKFEHDSLQERCQLLFQVCTTHLNFFFSLNAWSGLNGHVLPGSLHNVPWPKYITKIPPCLLGSNS